VGARALGVEGGAEDRGSGRKGDLEGVADHLVDGAAVAGDGRAHDGVVAGVGDGHGVRELPPETGAALDVGK
jgi:hypothetical protein